MAWEGYALQRDRALCSERCVSLQLTVPLAVIVGVIPGEIGCKLESIAAHG